MALSVPPSTQRSIAVVDPGGLSRTPAYGSSSSRSINGDSEKSKLLPAAPPPNPEDPLDKGCEPLTVQRKCTDVVWIFPFLVLLGVSAYATYEAAQVGNFRSIFRVPNFQSEMCGEGERKAKTFLYFCMKHDSQWVFDEANKSLELRYPICDDDANSWDWVQDYPTQPTAFFCRPHRAFSKGPPIKIPCRLPALIRHLRVTNRLHYNDLTANQFLVPDYTIRRPPKVTNLFYHKDETVNLTNLDHSETCIIAVLMPKHLLANYTIQMLEDKKQYKIRVSYPYHISYLNNNFNDIVE
eukprot:s685_g16.t1